jgi:hypothetical protein
VILFFILVRSATAAVCRKCHFRNHPLSPIVDFFFSKREREQVIIFDFYVKRKIIKKRKKKTQA